MTREFTKVKLSSAERTAFGPLAKLKVDRWREIAAQVLDFLTKLRTTTASVHPALQPALERAEAVVAAIDLWAATVLRERERRTGGEPSRIR